MKIIPLTQLKISEKNVRKAQNDNELDELVASLKHHGLQQNLVVIESDNAEDTYEVIAGGRRLRAMQQIADNDESVPNLAEWSIPCQLVDSVEATEISLAENLIRSAMHPADQMEAWSKMIDEGKTINNIATRFGVSEHTVRQRIRLGKVSPVLIQALRDEKLTLETLTAFTITDDHEMQLHVWDQVKNNCYNAAYSVRNRLTEDTVRSNSKLVKFVDDDAYENAGGTMKKDLFEEETYYENAALLEMLANKKLKQHAEESSGFKDVIVTLDEERENYSGMEWVEEALIDAPEGLEETYTTKKARYDDIRYGNYEDDDESEIDKEMLQEEHDRLEKEIEELEEEVEKYLGFKEEDKQESTLFIWLNYDGTINTKVMKPVIESEDDSSSEEQNGGDDNHGEINGSVQYSTSLKEDLNIYHGQMAQVALGDDFESAFDMTTFTMAQKAFCGWGNDDNFSGGSSPIDLQITAYRDTTKNNDQEETVSGQKRKAQRDKLNLEWLRHDDDIERYAAFQAITLEDKQAIFSYCTASGIVFKGYSTSYHPCFDILADKNEIKEHEAWRPTEENFFKRIKKPELLMLANDLIGESWVAKIADQKKGEIANWFGRVFSGDPAATSGMSGDTLEKIKDWMPDIMTFKSNDEKSSDENTPEWFNE